jgi:hypothetical protein
MMTAAIHTGFMRTSPFLFTIGMECSEAIGSSTRPPEAPDIVFCVCQAPSFVNTTSVVNTIWDGRQFTLSSLA